MYTVLVRFRSRTDGGEERWETEGESPRAGAYRFVYAGARYTVLAGERLILCAEGELTYRLELDPARETSVSIATPYGALSAAVRTARLHVARGADGLSVHAEYSLEIAGAVQDHALSVEFIGAAASERGNL